MTSIGTLPSQHRAAHRTSSTLTLDRALVGAGLLSSLLYVAMDQLCAARYPGYRMLDQAISELSAVGAPTQALWTTVMPWYGVLVLAFGIGVLRVAGRTRALRVAGALVVAFALSGALWYFFPMHQRGAEFDWRDLGHITLAVVSVALILAFVTAGAFAFGRRFRIYSYATVAALAIAGAITFSWADRVAAGQSTPWLGLVERVNIYGYLLWIAVLAVALLRKSMHRGATS